MIHCIFACLYLFVPIIISVTPPALWVWMQIISRNTQLLHYGIHVFTGGLETETDYKYRGHNEKCSMDKSKIRVKINDSVSISSNETRLYRFKSCVKLWMFVFDLHRFYYEINNQNMYLYMEVNNNEYLQIVTPIIYSIFTGDIYLVPLMDVLSYHRSIVFQKACFYSSMIILPVQI